MKLSTFTYICVFVAEGVQLYKSNFISASILLGSLLIAIEMRNLKGGQK